MIESFFKDYGIQYADGSASVRHAREGWIHIHCPYCTGNADWHLGFNLGKRYFYCWRCEWHPVVDVVMMLTGLTVVQAKKIVTEYRFGRRSYADATRYPASGTNNHLRRALYPPGVERTLLQPHKTYLRERGFDPSAVGKLYGLKSVGNRLGNPFRNRIIIPVLRDGRCVSFHGRDITERSPVKYKAVSREHEALHHRDTLYGLEHVEGSTVVVVEGQMDVWRLGPGAVATFGINYTNAQVRLIKAFPRRFVMFDAEEEQAKRQADKLANTLSAFKGETELLDLGYGDPASLDQEQANDFMKDIELC